MMRFDYIAHTGVVKEYRGFWRPMRLSPECRRNLRRSMPKDETWLVVLVVLAVAGLFISVPVMFVRWWLCL